jgi:hypothetical protein
MTFKKGDRVRLIKRYQTLIKHSPCPLEVGDEGVVVKARYGKDMWISVRWDRRNEHMHDCDGECDRGHGWNLSPEIVELVDKPVSVWATLERAIREAEDVIQSR